MVVNENFLRYLDAYYEISIKEQNINIQSLMDFLNQSVEGVSAFFRRHWSFINYFVEIKFKDSGSYTSYKDAYVLTEQGKTYIELIYYFRNYYNNL